MRYYVLLVRWWAGGRKELGKLSQTEGCKNGGNVRVVRERKVESLVKWEGRGHTIKSNLLAELAVLKSATLSRAYIGL